MEDENGLELSLTLAWSQSSTKYKEIGDNSSDTRPEEGDRSSKLINDFKHFLEGGTGSHRNEPSEPPKPEERGLWISNEEEKEPETSNKRKFIFEEISNQKKRERESHISINTDEGSTAENEDVADSEAVGSTSKKYGRGAMIPCETGNEVYTVFDTSAAAVSGQRGFSIMPEKGLRAGKVAYSANVLNMPASTSGKELGNAALAFGYSSMQLPILDKDNSRGLVSHASYAGRFPSTMDKLSDGSLKVSQGTNTVVQKPPEAPQYSATSLENTKNEDKQDESDKLSSELSSITPGISADLKFGGSGSYPNLPWVSTKGSNGRTISGVTYRFSPTQIKIVCACHGSHLSPEEFIRHAGEEKSGPESASFPGNNNPAASPRN